MKKNLKDSEPSKNPQDEIAKKPVVAYLTKRFPRLSETFILDEILGLELNGINLRLFALAHPGETVVQPDVAKVRSQVTYIHPPGGPTTSLTTGTKILYSHLRVALRYPLRYLGVVTYILRKRRSRSAIKHFFEAGRLADLAMRDDTAHIHAAFAHGPASTAHFVHLLAAIPFSFAAHAKDLYLSAPDLMARKVAAASFVLVCSGSAETEMKRIVAAHSVEDVRERGANKVILAYHGVNVERFSPSEHPAGEMPLGSNGNIDLHPGDEPVRILAVGRLVPKKGYPVLLKALDTLARSGRSFSCRIVGSGPMKDQLLATLASLDLEAKVELVGARTQQQIVQEYRLADVFVQASVVTSDGDRDGIPNSILEAMASGLAVVGTDVAGIPEVIDHQHNGLVVPPQDPDALAVALAALIDEPNLRIHLGAMARQHTIKHLSRQGCNAEIARHFQAQLDNHPAWIASRRQPETVSGFQASTPTTNWREEMS